MSTLQELFTEEIRDLYDAEKQLVKALPKMAKVASRPDLKKLFEDHTSVTKAQVERLEQIFSLIDERPRSKPCKGMKGLVEEGQEVMTEHSGDEMLDSAMIGAAQRVEHYEMAGYTSARSLAEALGLRKAAQLLDRTLREETQTDQKLSQVSQKILKEHLKEMAASEKAAASERAGSEKSGSRGATARQSRQEKSGRNGRAQAAAPRRAGSRNGSASGRGSASKVSKMTADHDEIRAWAEARGAEPACVRGTGGKRDAGLLRFDFPGYSGGDSLQHISWDEFFDKFDKNNLALLYQESTAEGKKSNFNKLVAREE